MPLNLLYFTGGPRQRILQAVLDAGHTVAKVFVNRPERWPKVLPTIELARSRGIPIETVQRKSDLSRLKEQATDAICLSAGFYYLFSPDFLANAKACFNVHGSLLPKYPGARTLSWAIENGELHSGVTVHMIDEGIDTGPILLQRSFPVSPFETPRSLVRKTLELEPALVVEALAKFEREGMDALRPQPHVASIHLPNRSPEHSRIDPNRPLTELFNAIRAADPDNYPAFFEWNGEKVCIRMWRPNKPSDEPDLI